MTVDGCGVRMADPGRVEAARAALAGTAALADAAEVFSLLGDPTRLSLLACLLEIGEMCVCDLAAATGQSESAVSHARGCSVPDGLWRCAGTGGGRFTGWPILMCGCCWT